LARTVTQVDGGGAFEVEFEIGFVGGDQGAADGDDVAASEIVRFERAGRHGDAGAFGLDAGVDNGLRFDAAELHADEVGEAHFGAGGERPDPDVDEREEDRENDQEENSDDENNADENGAGSKQWVHDGWFLGYFF